MAPIVSLTISDAGAITLVSSGGTRLKVMPSFVGVADLPDLLDRYLPAQVLAITDAWSAPRGVYNYESPDLPAFRAAALLALGRIEEARIDAAKVIRTKAERAIWAGNLGQLHAAIQRADRSFVYNPGVPYHGFLDWTVFPTPEP